jgi:hypothetical protein
LIRERSSPSQWKYVESKKNPADCASRGLSVGSFLVTNSWIREPDFLWTSEDSWPERPPSISEVTNDDPEVKQEIVVIVLFVETPRKFITAKPT